MRRLAVIICSLLLTLAAHAQDAAPLLSYVTAVEEESGAWSPLSLGSKLACWFDADDSATLLDAGGAPADAAEAVQTWQDKSGNGRHATAPAAAQRPTRQVGVQNGRAVVRTDGLAQLNIGSAAAVFRNETAGYIFAVAKDANQSGGDSVHFFITFTQGDHISIPRLGITGKYSTSYRFSSVCSRLDADLYQSIGSATELAGMTLLTAHASWGAGVAYCYTNSVLCASAELTSGSGETSDTDSLTVSMFRTAITTECPANSEIAEVIVVNAAMSVGEIAATQAYLKAKWGTP